MDFKWRGLTIEQVELSWLTHTFGWMGSPWLSLLKRFSNLKCWFKAPLDKGAALNFLLSLLTPHENYMLFTFLN